MPPSPGVTLEAVTLIYHAADPTKIPRMYRPRHSGDTNQARRFAAGALYYVGACDYALTAELLNFLNPQRVSGQVNKYQDMPRAIREPWEQAVRELAYCWRNEHRKKQQKLAAKKAWNGLPEIVKYVLDNNWQRKAVVTGPMLKRLRMINGLPKYEPPVWDCPMCRKLERRGLLNRTVLATRKRARAILCYRINTAGRRLLELFDATKQQRI